MWKYSDLEIAEVDYSLSQSAISFNSNSRNAKLFALHVKKFNPVIRITVEQNSENFSRIILAKESEHSLEWVKGKF